MLSGVSQIGFLRVARLSSFFNRIGQVEFDMHGSLIIKPHLSLRKKYPYILSKIIIELSRFHPHSRPFVVGIAGPRNATKSSTAKAIADFLGGKLKVVVLSMDNYFKPPEFFRHYDLNMGKDPIAMDFEKLVNHISTLCKRGTIRILTRDRFARDYRGPEVTISGAGLDLLLVEGMSAFLPKSVFFEERQYNPYAPSLASLFLLKIYLDIDSITAEKVMFSKSEKRRALGHPTLSKEKIYYRFRMVELPRFYGHHRTVRSNADVVCNLTYFNGEYQLSTMAITEYTLLKYL